MKSKQIEHIYFSIWVLNFTHFSEKNSVKYRTCVGLQEFLFKNENGIFHISPYRTIRVNFKNRGKYADYRNVQKSKCRNFLRFFV